VNDETTIQTIHDDTDGAETNMASDSGADLPDRVLPVPSGPGDSDRAPVVRDIFREVEVNTPKADGTNATEKLGKHPKHPKIDLGETPQTPQ
jgi:hypothetical protein